MNQVHFEVLVDMASADERALETCHDLAVSKRVLVLISRRLTIPELLERIKYSPLASELLADLPDVLGFTREALYPAFEELALPVNYEGEWSEVSLHDFIDKYWSVVIFERIARGDFRRAWDEMKKGIRWEPNRLALSPSGAETIVGELFAAITKKEPLTLPPARTDRRWGVPVPGLGVLAKLYGFPEPDEFGRPCDQIPSILDDEHRRIMALASYFSQKEKDRRSRRAKKKVEEKVKLAEVISRNR